MQPIGFIQAFYQNLKTGRMTKICEKKNLILYDAADIMAALLAGDNTRRISHMYFEYENTAGTPAYPAITRDVGGSYFQGLSGASNRDWVKAPIITTPALAVAGDNGYSGNMVTFTATTASVSPLTGKADPANYFAAAGGSGPSKIFSLGLVAASDSNNEAKDQVFSRVNLDPAMSLQANSNIVFFWGIRFN